VTADTTLRGRIAAALLARIKQAVVHPGTPLLGGGMQHLMAANEYDLADVVLPIIAAERASTSDEHLLRLTPQTCPAGLHADWAVDSEHDHACPWCEIDALRARADATGEQA
jgi:hypothetical protein